MSQLRRGVAATAMIAAVATLAGCSAGSSTPRANPTPSLTPSPSASPSPSPSPIVDPAAAVAVEAAYRGYWNAVLVAGRTADWDSPELARWATGSALLAIRRRFHGFAQEGKTARGNVKLDPTVVAAAATTATVRDCVDGSSWLAYDRNGRPIGKGVPRLDLTLATLVREGGSWRVSKIKVAERGCEQ